MASHEQNLLLKGKTLNTFKTSLSTTVAASTLFFATSITFILVFSTSPPPKSTYHSLYLSASDNETVSRHLFALTRRPHVAGSEANADVAAYILCTLSSYGLRTRSVSYAVSLSYPSSRSLTLSFPPHPPISFSLIQEVYPGDPYADVASEVIPTFHAYAKSGSAEARVAYANYGRLEDYATLDEMGVNVSGTVVLARYGKAYRGDIVGNAYERGAIGVVVYTDAKDYGGGRGGSWFPEGPGMPPSGVQVGSVDKVVGDPTTPGWASTGGCERMSDEEVEKSGGVPLIPSLPVSSTDGETIMRTIGGKVAPDDWQGATGGPVYRLGPGPAILNLTYNGTQRITEIQNVFGVIEGAEEADRYVLLGNHHDAWTFGAGDPNSGTATMLEVARRFEKLKKRGWKPRRTIVLCNWDAEEFHLIGSTEWVEENRELLASRVVAYLNIDSAVYGPRFRASSTPQLDNLIKHVTQQVQDPNDPSKTVYESWTGSEESPVIERLGGGGSDFAAFIQHVGVPSLDISFEGEFSVYHSLYDDFIWMHKFGDPMFQRHVAAASIWGLLTLKLADEVFLPFDYLQYAFELHRSTTELEEELLGNRINLGPLYKSIEEFKEAATEINVQRKALESNGWQSIWSNNQLKVRELNDRLMMAERAFADRDWLSDRPWYKHLGSQRITAIQNVFGVIEGVEEPDRYVLLGNHHDAWTFGAVDPSSGTATMLEVARRLTKLQKRGWKPRRTIVLCSWDAEEYHLIGSTEWVEENRELLASRVVAYLNIDMAVSGPRFGASSTPQLDKLLKYVTQQVQHPDDSTKTVYESWTGSEDSPMIGRLGGGGSDYAAFVQHVGVPAVDITFRGEYPVYHSLYDDFIWMKKFGDPMFKRHVAAASIWGLLALKLADEVFLPFDYLQYGSELHRSSMELEADILGKPVNLAPLYKSIEELKKAATEINIQRKALESKVWQSMRGNDQLKVRELNDRLMMAERAFTDRDGLFDRPWYKHLIYGPPKHNTYGSKSFPGIDDAIEKAKSLNTTALWKSVQHEVWRVSRAVTHVSLVLNGKLT